MFDKGFYGFQSYLAKVFEDFGSIETRAAVNTVFSESLRSAIAQVRCIPTYDIDWQNFWMTATTQEFDVAREIVDASLKADLINVTYEGHFRRTKVVHDMDRILLLSESMSRVIPLARYAEDHHNYDRTNNCIRDAWDIMLTREGEVLLPSPVAHKRTKVYSSSAANKSLRELVTRALGVKFAVAR